MSEAKFTKGEWRVDGDDIVCPDVPCIQICAGEIGPDFYHVADVASQYDDDKNEFVITERDRANAYLIAAAPEMYDILAGIERLETLFKLPDDTPEEHRDEAYILFQIWSDAVEVLKKARGEE